MNIGEKHNRRRIRAAIAGANVAVVLAGIAIAMIRPGILGEYEYIVGGEVCPPSSAPARSWHVCCAVLRNLAIGGTLLSVVGAAMGIAGGARRITFRATAVGAAIFAFLAGVAPLMLGSAAEAAEARHEAIEQTWMFAVVFAFFSLTSCAGAIVTGKKSDDGRTRVQFTLAEILLAFIPFAVFMGFLAHFPKK